MKLPAIMGNEIVPVRLIPVFTHDSLGQKPISGILANRLRVDGFPADPDYDSTEIIVDGEFTSVSRAERGLSSRCARDVNVFACHLNENSEPVKMLSIEWDNIYRDISVLAPVLRKEEELIGVNDALASAWSLKATKLLPPGVFLWRHDLDVLWQYHNSFYLHWFGEHSDARILNYDAYVRPEVRSLYLEGFEHLMPVNDNTTKNNDLLEKKCETVTEPSTLKTSKVTESGKCSRKDALAKVLYGIVTDYRDRNARKPQYNEVLATIKKLAKDKNHTVIQEVSEGKIFWLNRHGKEKSTSIHQLQNRLTKID
jgi:hypothetical protein